MPVILSFPGFMQDGVRLYPATDVFALAGHFQHRVSTIGYQNHTGMGINWLPYSLKRKFVTFSVGTSE